MRTRDTPVSWLGSTRYRAVRDSADTAATRFCREARSLTRTNFYAGVSTVACNRIWRNWDFATFQIIQLY